MWQEGKPQLPVKYVHLLIPPGSDVDSIIVSTQTTVEIEGNYCVYPAQRFAPLSYPPITNPFTEPDSAVYGSSSPFPGRLTKVERYGYFDGCNRILTLAIYPVQYTPAESTLSLCTALAFELSFKPSTSKPITPGGPRLPHVQKIYDEYLKSLVENPEDIALYFYRPEMGGGNRVLAKPSTGCQECYPYVIITHDSLEKYFKGYAEWMSKKGLPCVVVDQFEIRQYFESGDTISNIVDGAGSIRQYLYRCWNRDDKRKVTFALLAGIGDDVFGGLNVVPVRIGLADNNPSQWKLSDHIPADLYYSEFGGNWNVDGDTLYGEPDDDSVEYSPEIFVGRIQCITGEDVENWTNKVLDYEMRPGDGDFSYLRNHLCCQADEPETAAVCDTFSKETYFPGFIHYKQEELPSGNDDSPYYPYGYEVIEKMNERGYGFVDWKHHGLPTAAMVRTTHTLGKQDKILSTVTTYDNYPAEIDSGADDGSNNGLDLLTNETEYFVMYATNCYLAASDSAHADSNRRCVAEGLLFEDSMGAVAFLGNTRHGWEVHSENLEKYFLQSLDSCKRPLGQAEAYSKDELGGIRKHELALSHNLMGDPQLHAWPGYWDVPGQFANVIHDWDDNSVTVFDEFGAPVESAQVCFWDMHAGSPFDSIFYSVVFTDGAGYAQTDLNVNPEHFSVVITKYYFLPYERTPGQIDQNVEKAGRWIIANDVTIASGDTLAIEPNTILLFESEDVSKSGIDTTRVELIVNGTLLSRGTVDQPIAFRPRYSNSGSGSWYGIRVMPGGSAQLEYAGVVDAYCGIDYANSADDTVKSCHFTGNEMYGIKATNSNLFILDNVIEKPDTSTYLGYAISLSSGSAPMITGNQIKNYKYGIYKTGSGAPVCRDNKITKGDIGAYFYRNSSYVTLKATCFDGKFEQSYVKCDRGKLHIDSCYMKGDDTDPTAKGVMYMGYLKWKAYGSIMRSGIFNYSDDGVYIYHSQPSLMMGHNSIYSFDGDGNLHTAIEANTGMMLIDAERNWWGTDRPDTVANLFIGPVSYQPWDTSEPAIYDACAGFGGAPLIVTPQLIPEKFSLMQNYPNPFNAATVIRYSLPRESKVSIKIYNILGRLVAKLVDGTKPAGLHEVVWDGTNRKGEKVSSGIYFYRIQTEDFDQVKKMVLLK